MSTKNQYFVLCDGQTRGPFTATELRCQARTGELRTQHFIRHGAGSWVPVSRVGNLSVHLSAPIVETSFRVKSKAASPVQASNDGENIPTQATHAMPYWKNYWQLAKKGFAEFKRGANDFWNALEPHVNSFLLQLKQLALKATEYVSTEIAQPLMSKSKLCFIHYWPIVKSRIANVSPSNRRILTKRNLGLAAALLAMFLVVFLVPRITSIPNERSISGKTAAPTADARVTKNRAKTENSMVIVNNDADRDSNKRESRRDYESQQRQADAENRARQYYFEQQRQAQLTRQLKMEQQSRRYQALAEESYRRAQAQAEYEAQRAMDRYRNQMSERMGALGINW